jgi:hypothetical protein
MVPQFSQWQDIAPGRYQYGRVRALLPLSTQAIHVTIEGDIGHDAHSALVGDLAPQCFYKKTSEELFKGMISLRGLVRHL